MFRKIFIFVIFTIVLQLTAYSQDLLELSLFKNSGFENGFEDWRLDQGWSKMPETMQSEVFFIQKDKEVFEGKQYIRIKNNSKDFVALTHPIKYKKGITYKISYWYKGYSTAKGSQKGKTRLRVYGCGGKEYFENVSYNSKDWQKNEILVTALNNGQGDINLWIWPGGVCDIDNFMIRENFWQIGGNGSPITVGDQVDLQLIINPEYAMKFKVKFMIFDLNNNQLYSDLLKIKTPVSESFKITPSSPGTYTVKADLKAKKRTPIEEYLNIFVITKTEGVEGVKDFWETEKK